MRKSAVSAAADSLLVDGGAARDKYLMQFQSDILGLPVFASKTEEFSGLGAAYAAGIALGIYDKSDVFTRIERISFVPTMDAQTRAKKIDGWKSAVNMVMKY
jgi:glycerol kinase